METRAHHVLIGLFSLLVSIGALLFALWLAQSRSDQQYKLYDVIFNEAVTGLSEGGTVQYSGIRVGDVVSLRLNPDDPRKVRARIRVFDTTPIREDTRAKLALTGVTGMAIIQLSSAAQDSPPLASATGVPVIKTLPSPLAKLLANGEDIATNLNNLVSNMNSLFSPENLQRINQTLDNLQQSTSVLAEQRKDIQQMLQQLALASEQARLALSSAHKLLEQTNKALNGRAQGIVEDTQKTLSALRSSSERLEKLLSNNQQAIGEGLNGIREIGPAIRELRTTLKDLRSVSKALQEDPAGYLLGRDSSKEFQP